MNGTWLAFITLMLVVLIAVAVGAQQMEAQQAQKIAQLTDQRALTLDAAQEALEQRNAALKEREEALAQLEGLNATIAALQSGLEKVSLEAQTANSAAVSKQQEIDRLVKEASELRAQMTTMQARYVELEAAYTTLKQNSPQITVTGDDTAVTGTIENSGICLPVQAGLPNQLGLGLAILVGMAALGSGGYIYYRHDPNRKYEVRMTKEQIRDYARYQRERGNRAA